MNLLERIAAGQFKKTGAVKKLSISGQPNNTNNTYEVFSIPLDYLYYNNQNGRINTAYKQYQASHGRITPEAGNSEYNSIFQKLVYESNPQALKDTLQSIKEKTQQEPGVILPDGRVIDGNRRFTALRMYQEDSGISKNFETVVLSLDSRTDKKTIKELELDLQLGQEARVDYDPIDRIFNVYDTIELEKLMTVEEYRNASGAGNTRGINRDLRLAHLILRFLNLVSPGSHDEQADKFYLARELKLDGPIEEIERTLSSMEDSDKESITDAVLVSLAAEKASGEQRPSTLVMRDIKTNILQKPDILKYYLDAVDDRVDAISEAFQETPIKSASDLKAVVSADTELKNQIDKMKNSTNRLVYKGKVDSKRKRALSILQDIEGKLDELKPADFAELTTDENYTAKEVLSEINDILFKLKRDLNA